MNLIEKAEYIKIGKISAVDNLNSYLERISKKEVRDLNIFLSINKHALEKAREIDDKVKRQEPTGKLAGLVFSVKSNICVKGLETNCASKVLEGYIAPYNATAISKLLNEDAIVIGMTNMDEFACGGSGETSAFGPTKNPKNPDLIPGGSSSGPAASVAADLCDFAIGSDTGGSIRNPASHCGVFGLKPTYGSVSRYGLIDLAMSTDTIGPITKSPQDAKIIFDIIKGKDYFDNTTKEVSCLMKKEMKIGLVNVDKFADAKICNLIKNKTFELNKKKGFDVKEIDLPLDIAIETYYILTYVEFYSGTRKFDGRRFGRKIEDYCGPEVLRRILGGSEITKAEYEGKFYREALRAREYIKEKFREVFNKVDLIILPTVPKTPHKIGSKISVEEMYAYDIFTTPASLAGLPAASYPAGVIDGKDVGLQIIAPEFCEDWIFEFLS